MTYTKQEIEEAVKDAQNNGIGGLMTKESLNILVGIAQSLLDGKIGELPKPQEVMGREEILKILDMAEFALTEVSCYKCSGSGWVMGKYGEQAECDDCCAMGTITDMKIKNFNEIADALSGKIRR